MTKKSLIKGSIKKAGSSAAVVLFALGVLGSTQALAGITNTKHNLGSTVGNPGVNKFNGTGEICVFCHTPHGGDDSASVPLWNRQLSTSGTSPAFTTYNTLNTSSLDGATVAVGSVSVACLSCHDGTQAMSTMINAPGSGTVGNAAFVTANTAFAGWSGANQTAGQLKTTVISNIGKDLQNDHPIGIQYAGGPKATGNLPAAAGTPYTTFKDPDFNSAQTLELNGQLVWYVETGTGGSGRQKTDMALYTRTDAYLGTTGASSTITASVAQPYVECASCHDPHTETPLFLRVENTGSAVCLACHIK